MGRPFVTTSRLVSEPIPTACFLIRSTPTGEPAPTVGLCPGVRLDPASAWPVLGRNAQPTGVS